MSSLTTEQSLIQDFPKKDLYTKACKNLSSGIVNVFEPPLKDVHKQLVELEQKQRDLIQKLHTENVNISEVQHSDELQAMFIKIKLYHSKLQALKKNIKVLHERSTKLKKRAVKLQQVIEKKPVEEIIISIPSSSVIRASDPS